MVMIVSSSFRIQVWSVSLSTSFLHRVFKCPRSFRSWPVPTHPGSTVWPLSENQKCQETRSWEGRDGGREGGYKITWSDPGSKQTKKLPRRMRGEIFTRWGSFEPSWYKSIPLWKEYVFLTVFLKEQPKGKYDGKKQQLDHGRQDPAISIRPSDKFPKGLL